MPIESRKVGLESKNDAASTSTPERPATGPFADEPEGPPDMSGAEAISGSPKEFDLKEFLAQMEASRAPEAEVDAPAERERVSREQKRVAALLEEEKERNEKLRAARQGLGIPHEDGERVRELEEAKKRLEEEEHTLELASEYNDVLDSFGQLSKGEIQHIAETGKTSGGESVRSRTGKEVHTDIARELAGLHLRGGRRVTWGTINQLEEIADRVLHDIVSAVRGIFRGPEGGGGKSRVE